MRSKLTLAHTVIEQTHPPHGSSILCEACGIRVAHRFHSISSVGAGILESVFGETGVTWTTAPRDLDFAMRRGEVWACSDECEAKILKENGMDPETAGLR